MSTKAVNKVIYNGTTLVDLTGDTVTADALKSGYTAHQADGEWITGTAVPASNPNLLDNWCFADPINQRGNTEFTGTGYTIDRWKIHNGVSSNEFSVALQNNGVRLNMTRFREYWSSWRTVLEMQRFVGIDGNLTFSILYKGCSADNILYLRVDKNNTEYFAASGTAIKGDGILTLTFSVSSLESNSLSCGIFLKNVGEAIIVAAKLEPGVHQTLAHQEGDKWILNDPLSNKSLELVKCQRYQLSVAGNMRIRMCGKSNDYFDFWIPTPTTLRAIPTIPATISVTNLYGSLINGCTYEIPLISSNGFLLRAHKQSHGMDDAQIRTTAAHNIFDANL